jgi:glyoxylase-like metal-dependent hydrolase (beta-lactamase superfamily II)
LPDGTFADKVQGSRLFPGNIGYRLEMSIVFPVSLQMTSDSLRVHTGGFTFTNGYLLSGTGGNIAVDAPEGFADWLERLGVKLEALLLTHWHFDHVVDAARLAREHGCQIYAWGPSTPETRLELHLKQWAGIEYSVENYPVDHCLQGVPAISVAGRDFRLEHVPGHSPDSLVYIEAAAGRVFSGDTLMQEGIGRSDFPDGDGDLLVRGIRKKILTLPEVWAVFSGHGRPTTVGSELESNPYL